MTATCLKNRLLYGWTFRYWWPLRCKIPQWARWARYQVWWITTTLQRRDRMMQHKWFMLGWRAGRKEVQP